MEADGVNRRIFLPGFIALAAVLAVGVFWLMGRGSVPLPVYGELPEFSLPDSRGGTLTLKSLFGKVWVVHTIFTRCEDTCPLQMTTLEAMGRELKASKELRFLAISIDPKHDTPAILARYARSRQLDMSRWVLLSGPEKSLANLVGKNGLRLPHALTGVKTGAAGALLGRLAEFLAPGPAYGHSPQFHSPQPGGNPVVHSSRFVLLDRRARVRGYYRSAEEESLEKLRADLRVLLGQ
jgi:protein SCO1/2